VLVHRADIPHMRPAHIHFGVEANGYQRIITHLFRRDDEYIETDAVFGVKDGLIIDFVSQAAGTTAPTGEKMSEPYYVVKYDFVMQKAAALQSAAAS
jgi:hydroxyquinol 1,2-dioxygenase